MNQLSKIKSVLLLTILPISTVSIALESQQPKSTIEILRSIANKKGGDFYDEIKGIPKFDPQRHSDGCSGGMSAAYAKLKFLHSKYGETLPWRQCCVVHDRAYYYGGEENKKIIADKALKNCVSKEVSSEHHMGLVLGILMEKAVWIGGHPYFPTTYRWGYGEDFRGTEGLPIHK